MDSKFIIRKNQEILGYLNTEKETIETIDSIVGEIMSEEKKMEGIRIFFEKVDNGINIYRQETGSIFNGPVNLIHTITYSILHYYKTT
jgi:hypothetical protein